MTLLIYILIGLVGMLAHWLKKWARDEIDCSLYQYCMTYKKHTIGAVITMIGSVLTIYSGGPDLSQVTATAVFIAGFAADSAANKAPEPM